MENQDPTQKEEPVNIPEKPKTMGTPAHPFPKFLPKPIALIVIVLIATALLSGLVFTVYNLGRSSILKELNPTAPVIPPADPVNLASPTPASNAANADPATADWKTFTNSDFGYSFKHPSNLKIEELEDQYNLITANKTKSIKISPDSGEYLLNIFVEKNSKNLSAVDLLMKYKSTIEKPTNPNDPSGKFVIDKINSSLSEYKNGEIEGLHALFGFDYDYDIVIATKNNNIYVFDYYGDQGGKITENNEKIVDQILSTFRFE